jgi:hypothetical protein
MFFQKAYGLFAFGEHNDAGRGGLARGVVALCSCKKISLTKGEGGSAKTVKAGFHGTCFKCCKNVVLEKSG